MTYFDRSVSVIDSLYALPLCDIYRVPVVDDDSALHQRILGHVLCTETDRGMLGSDLRVRALGKKKMNKAVKECCY